ncbi:hypothetical protein NDU88_001667 [Pleurodeles waltl]|uniref:Uncharacterized protein n=1 Tax=Pleurodeles waltl TaxID=8319 RepID=A0AAV7MVA6_PLEWA|nr:hypothetical protein NDU88_001667 [Pleurodeles waltl]
MPSWNIRRTKCYREREVNVHIWLWILEVKHHSLSLSVIFDVLTQLGSEICGRNQISLPHTASHVSNPCLDFTPNIHDMLLLQIGFGLPN